MSRTEPTIPAIAANGFPPAAPARRSRGPLNALLDLFSSVWLGVTLLAILFIYSSIGSSGVPVHPNILDPAHWVSVRQMRPFEMTEMEWFHWWPFNTLIALICANIVITTLRRIPFNVLNLGVWMIHSGILILAAGSVYYFMTKVEGDAPVNRRVIIAKAPGMAEPATMLALPGNSMVIGTGNDAYRLQVTDIDPQWELLSGDDAGRKAHKISVRVESRGGTFTRDMIAGRPQYTQDILRNTDPNGPPMVRAVNVIGKPLVDEALELSLDYDPQQHFYVMDSRAVYLREVDAHGHPKTGWIQRPIREGGLPRYHDYIRLHSDVFMGPRQIHVHGSAGSKVSMNATAGEELRIGQGNDARLVRVHAVDPEWVIDGGRRQGERAFSAVVSVSVPGDESEQTTQRLVEGTAERVMGLRLRLEDDPLSPHPIHVEVPAAEPNDPLPNVTLRVNRYLRYAYPESRRRPAADGPLDPTVSLRIFTPTSESQQYQLIALDPLNNSILQGSLMFAWVDTPAALERLKQRVDPVIRFSVPDAEVEVEHAITRTTAADPNLPFTPIEGSEYSYRVENYQDNLRIGERMMSVAIVQIKGPDRTFKRWIFDDPAANRDMAMAEGLMQHDADLPLDTTLHSVYRPGSGPPAPIMVIAGPRENDLAVMVTKTTGPPQFDQVQPGQRVEITQGVSLAIDRYAARTLTETRPFVVPREQRDRDMREFLSMIKVELPLADGAISSWLQYHHFAFESAEEVLRRFPYRPQVVTLPDGRRIEMMFSRERRELPAPVVLEDFQVASHIGGFTGQTSSIMDWTSVIRFADDDGGWTDAKTVSMNKPADHKGYWYFQAQWDPPDRPRFEGDPPSRGLNYTVLGVGNRNGVNVQLAGCCIAVLGMIYAFYVKPMIKRRRQQAVYSQLVSQKEPSPAETPVPAGAAWKVQS